MVPAGELTLVLGLDPGKPMLLCMALLFRLVPLVRQGTSDFDFMRLRSPSTSDLPHPPLVRDSVPRHFLSLTVLGATLAALVCRRNRWPVRDLHQAGSQPCGSGCCSTQTRGPRQEAWGGYQQPRWSPPGRQDWQPREKTGQLDQLGPIYSTRFLTGPYDMEILF